MEKNEKIGLGIVGVLTIWFLTRQKGSEDPYLTRDQMIDEIIFRCKQQTEGCEAQRPELEKMSDDQLRLIVEEIRKLAGSE